MQNDAPLGNGRILRTRLNVSYEFSHEVPLEGVSVYGTGTTFVGHATPGDTLTLDSSWEYSMTRNWVLALDFATKGINVKRQVDIAVGESGFGHLTVAVSRVARISFSVTAVGLRWRRTTEE